MIESYYFYFSFYLEHYYLKNYEIKLIYHFLILFFKNVFFLRRFIDYLWFFYVIGFVYFLRGLKNFSLFYIYLYFSKPLLFLSFKNFLKLFTKWTILRSPFVYKTTREQFEKVDKKVLIGLFLIFDSVWSNDHILLDFIFLSKYYSKNYLGIKKKVYFKNKFLYRCLN